jgi:hypothetical protein
MDGKINKHGNAICFLVCIAITVGRSFYFKFSDAFKYASVYTMLGKAIWDLFKFGKPL